MAKRKKSTPSYDNTDTATAISPQVDELVRDSTKTPEGTHLDSVAKDILGDIQDSQDIKTRWSQKQDFYYRMRYRIRRTKDFPFIGCSNLGLPTIEKFLRKIKASIFNIFWGIRPHSIMIPESSQSYDIAMRLEHYVDWLLETKVKFANKLAIAIDKMEEKGFSVAEPLWVIKDEKRSIEIDMSSIPPDIASLVLSSVDSTNQSTLEKIAELFQIDLSDSVKLENLESLSNALSKLRNGEMKVSLTICDETYNNVDINIHDPENVYVPIDSGIDPQECRFVAYEVYEPWEVVKSKARNGIYSKDIVDDMEAALIIGSQSTPSQGKDSFNPTRTTDMLKDQREGIERAQNQSKSVKLLRTYAWYDLDGDGEAERNVFILAPEWKKCLTAFPFPYAHRKWPCIRFNSEMVDDRWFSCRGIPEMIEDIAKEIDTQHNQKIDQQTIRNVPMFTYRSGVVNSRFVKFIPGQAIPVNGLTPLDDAVKVLRNESSNAEYSYRDEEMLLKLEVQELYGVQDFSLQSVVNRRQPRTASEVMAQQQSGSVVFSLDSLLFSESMSDMLTQVVQLIQQYLPDKVFFSVVGEGVSAHLSREEIQGNWLVRPRGNDINTNPQKRMEMAQARQQLLINPYYIQTGIVTPVNAYMDIKETLQYMGDVNWQQKISIPQPPPPPQPPPAITNIKTNFDELTDIEQAQVLQSAGIKPDMQGRLLHRQEDIVDKMSDKNPKEGIQSSEA